MGGVSLNHKAPTRPKSSFYRFGVINSKNIKPLGRHILKKDNFLGSSILCFLCVTTVKTGDFSHTTVTGMLPLHDIFTR